MFYINIGLNTAKCIKNGTSNSYVISNNDNDNDKKNHIFPQISLIFQGNLPAPLKE